MDDKKKTPDFFIKSGMHEDVEMYDAMMEVEYTHLLPPTKHSKQTNLKTKPPSSSAGIL